MSETLKIVFSLFLSALILSFIFQAWVSRNDPKEPTHADIVQALKNGDRIRAIRLYRKIHGASLGAAKAAISKISAEED